MHGRVAVEGHGSGGAVHQLRADRGRVLASRESNELWALQAGEATGLSGTHQKYIRIPLYKEEKEQHLNCVASWNRLYQKSNHLELKMKNFNISFYNKKSKYSIVMKPMKFGN